MTALLEVLAGLLLIVMLRSITNLQSSLERWDSERHLED
jgi:hypothetical protein